jgi:hypothetical protein
MGRWPGKAPVGYSNWTDPDGKKYIIPKQPEADHIKWSFEQLATGSFTISQVRRMAWARGFQCLDTHFWKLIHNPVYCGIVKISANQTEQVQFVKAIHEPLISENLFKNVQQIINKDANKKCNKDHLKHLFPLRGFLHCPSCGRKLTGSQSQGRVAKYSYYHCAGDKCKVRFRAEKLNRSYEDELKKTSLRPEVHELFGLVLEDENIFTCRREYSDKRESILKDLSKQDVHISKARKYFLDEKIDFDDFSKLKKEYNESLFQLHTQLKNINQKITTCDLSDNLWPDKDFTVFQAYNDLDIKGKRDIISLFAPASITRATSKFDHLTISEVISLVIRYGR